MKRELTVAGLAAFFILTTTVQAQDEAPQQGGNESTEPAVAAETKGQEPAPPPPVVDTKAPTADKQFEVFAPEGGGVPEAPVSEAVPEETPSNRLSTGNIPESYSIQRGDTLWDICQKLLDNPWYWPKLWSLNEYIANPHIIAPGDRVTFYAGGETTLPSMDVVKSGEAPPEEAAQAPAISAAPADGAPASSAAQGPRALKIKVRSMSLVSEKTIRAAGTISHSGAQKMELSAGDTVYLKFRDPKTVKPGDRFHVIQIVKKVTDPGKVFGKLGYLVRKDAVVRVKTIHRKTVEGVIVDCVYSVRRGDKLIPYRSPIRSVTVHSAAKEVKGLIVEAENQQYLVSSDDFVFLNLGRKDGIDDGTLLVVVRRGDGIFQGDDKKLPDVSVGRLLVVETGENVSTAYVTDLKDSLQIGDRVRDKAD